MNTMGRSSVSLLPSTIGLIVQCGVLCFFFASVKLAKREPTGMDRMRLSQFLAGSHSLVTS